ncbi:TrkA-C domain protein [Desulfobulbus propionicus DSM 2032]|uniref:TrkA-C domain protein n=1 Tax=Desulfobulbus propionicus (strain ATCC 33891 / DSM 2032 / VKM B-1956 / 1pr3) TaxID=577650 RepID=A0A7U3YP06_DESPD|nr:Trk system potassium transporter TrkA [Desulfobulbus propionicus]ADW18891.1 TrkA-C domain protein [Desulfobulbus propionicus DSM 2032]
MNILIYGATETGYMVASQLYRKHNIVIVDDLDRLPEKFSNLDISFVAGNGADVLVLERANAAKAELFIACSLIDEANIVACWTAKKITEAETICFIRRMELYRNLASLSQNRYQSRYDIDTIIWPEQLLTQDIFRIIMVPDAIDVEYFVRGKAKLFEYRIKEQSIIRGSRIMDCSFPQNVLIVGITRNNSLFIPNGSTTIQTDDKVVFMGTGPALDTLAAQFFQNVSKIKTASVIGGGSVGFMLAQKLEQAGIRVKLIEHDRARCIFLADNLKDSLILQGDGTDLELLEGESIGDSDVTVCVTNNDEKNLLCSLLVKQLGCERIITRVSNVRNSTLFERVGIDVVVSPRDSALKELLNRLQAKDVNILALVEGGQGEVLRLTLPETFPETLVRDFKLPARAIIGVVKRGRNVIFPHGDTPLQPDDQLIIFTMAKDAEAIKAVFTR